MKIYELNNKGCISVECLPPIAFHRKNVCWSDINEIELRLEYQLEEMPFDINSANFSILFHDIHKNLPCGTLFVQVPVGEDFDTITYIVRFDEKEFEKIKKNYLTNFLK